MSDLAGRNFWEDTPTTEEDTSAAEPPLAQPVEMPPDPEEYLPPDPRPDDSLEAAEADVAEQVVEVPEDESDDYR